MLNEHLRFASASQAALDHYPVFVIVDATDVDEDAAFIPGRRADEFAKLLPRVREGGDVELLYPTIAPSVSDHEGTQAFTSAKPGLRDLDRVYKQILARESFHARERTFSYASWVWGRACIFCAQEAWTRVAHGLEAPRCTYGSR